MNKEEVMSIAQLLSSMKDSLSKLEDAYRRRDSDQLNEAKKTILFLQAEIDKRL
jgi:hypothetical protein